jgi:hypothetical protein
MLQKSGKWLADWRDSNGTRHRKAFASKSEAERYSRKRAAIAKKARTSRRSANSRRNGRPLAQGPIASSTTTSRNRFAQRRSAK